MKRAIDLLFGIVGLGAGLVLFPFLAIAIRLDSPGPVLYRSRRLGHLGRPISIVKYRTMFADAAELFNEDGSRLVEANDQRITRIGRLLRGGLDEMPQAWQVVRGRMSVVGPRPDDLFAVDYYQPAHWLRLQVKPGITGLGQISGRTQIPWADRLAFDVYYVQHRTLALDLRIIWHTMLRTFGFDPPALVTFETVLQSAGSPGAHAAGLACREEVLAAREQSTDDD